MIALEMMMSCSWK